MAPEALDDLNQFQWQPCPEGQRIIDRLLARFLAANPDAAELARAMREQTGTRFFDWVDHLAVPGDATLGEELEAAGFVGEPSSPLRAVFSHPGAIFPRVVLEDRPGIKVAIKVESAADFAAAHGLQIEVEGIPCGQLRAAAVFEPNDEPLWVVERHGWRGFDDPATQADQAIRGQFHLEGLRARRRNFDDDGAAFACLGQSIDAAIDELGVDWAADLFFASERDYWMRRNRAARVQKARQDALGLGWANHDHHTYRCRRATFPRVAAVFEKLGCTLRERFYAGAEAGWGAQIFEQPATGVVIFADVDMSPDEVTGDFAHDGFSERTQLGTVGLWCELHGESMFAAGMHHLECQFEFDSLRDQMLAEAGIGMMKPFTDFDYLRQQFTEGERWAVEPARVDRILSAGQITAEQAERFKREGAIGSHLENLERNDGFKGFNQTGINEIIAKTDPRKQLVG